MFDANSDKNKNELLSHPPVGEGGAQSLQETIKTDSLEFVPAKPKRCLTAYNIFFQQERRRLLEELQQEHRVLSSSQLRPRNEKGHGKIGFADLARTVSAKWKATPLEDRQVYEELASQDKVRYMNQMETWKRMVEQQQLRLQQEQAPLKLDSSKSKGTPPPKKTTKNSHPSSPCVYSSGVSEAIQELALSQTSSESSSKEQQKQWIHPFSPKFKNLNRASPLTPEVSVNERTAESPSAVPLSDATNGCQNWSLVTENENSEAIAIRSLPKLLDDAIISLHDNEFSFLALGLGGNRTAKPTYELECSNSSISDNVPFPRPIHTDQANNSSVAANKTINTPAPSWLLSSLGQELGEQGIKLLIEAFLTH